MIKEVKSLKSRKYRDEKGLFFIEGLKFVREALKEKAEITRIFVSEELAGSPGGKTIIGQIGKIGISAIEPPVINILPAKLFNEISDTGTPQGILAVIKMGNHELKREIEEDGLYAVLESIQDPGNMGTIIRTADAAGFSGVIIFKGCVDVYNPKVLRSTMGSIFHIPIFLCDKPYETLEMLKASGIRLYASHLKGNVNYYKVNMEKKAAVIIGNESRGISEKTSSLADALVKIPMIGRAESLNASVAAGLLMYESVRQRMFAKLNDSF